MDSLQPIVVSYLVYVGLSVALTVWVAHTLFKSGRVFLVDSFHGNQQLADSVNRLLVVGFYLINLGYVTLALRTSEVIRDARGAIELLSWKVGLVLLVLGGMHFFNMWLFGRMRRRSTIEQAPPPFLPDEILDAAGRSTSAEHEGASCAV